MKARILIVAISALLAPGRFALAQKTDPDKNAKSGREAYTELAKAPEKARSRANPLERDSQAVAAGRLLFEDHCAECHGQNAEGGQGKKHGPTLRASEVQNATDGALFWLLTNGVVRKGMPVWSRLPEPQRWQLVRYIKSLGVAEESRAVADPKP